MSQTSSTEKEDRKFIAVFSAASFLNDFGSRAPSFIATTLVFAFIRDRKTGKLYKGLVLRSLSFNFKLFLFLSSVFAPGSFGYSFLLLCVKRLRV